MDFLEVERIGAEMKSALYIFVGVGIVASLVFWGLLNIERKKALEARIKEVGHRAIVTDKVENINSKTADRVKKEKEIKYEEINDSDGTYIIRL